MNIPRMYTVSEAAQILRIGKTLAYKELANGNLKAVKLRKKTFITQEEIIRYLGTLPAYHSTDTSKIEVSWRKK